MSGQVCRNESLLASFLPLKISALKMSHDRWVNGREMEGPSTSVYITPPYSFYFYQNLTLYLIVPCNISFHYTAYPYKMKGMKQLFFFQYSYYICYCTHQQILQRTKNKEIAAGNRWLKGGTSRGESF